MYYPQGENYGSAQGEHGGYSVKGSEPCGSEMIHLKDKLVNYDMKISSRLLVVVSQCVRRC